MEENKSISIDYEKIDYEKLDKYNKILTKRLEEIEKENTAVTESQRMNNEQLNECFAL